MSKQDTIFLLDGADDLREVEQTPYASEDLLQTLVERHPELLAGAQMAPEDPPRWLLVKREAGVPDAEEASNRWSLDHLFVDQFSVPTLVEVKRSTDTRIRREVVGQMLDYAANAQKYWSAESLRHSAEAQHGGAEALVAAVAVLLDVDLVEEAERVEQFWTEVGENLRRGRLRLVFLADAIPSELRRVIEFLNEHMPQIDVIGLELVQYARGELRVLVPRLVGQTEAARGAKVRAGVTRGSTRKTTRDELLAACPEQVASAVRGFLARAETGGLDLSWGVKGMSVRTADATHRRRGSVFYVYPPGSSGAEHAQFQFYLKEGGFTVDEQAILRKRLHDLGFQDSGEFTLKLDLDERGLARFADAERVAWEVEAMLRRAREQVS